MLALANLSENSSDTSYCYTLSLSKVMADLNPVSDCFGIYRHRLTWEPQMLQALSIHVCALSSGYYDLRRYTDREAAFIVFESQPALCA